MRRAGPSIAVALVLALVVRPAAAAGAGRAYAVVVSSDVAVSEISLSELRRLIRFERRFWKAGQAVHLILPAPESRTREIVFSRLFERDEAGVRRLILERLFQGELDLAPKVADSDPQALSFTSAGRGLLAVVSSQTAGLGAAHVLRINGKLPGEAGYPLAD